MTSEQLAKLPSHRCRDWLEVFTLPRKPVAPPSEFEASAEVPAPESYLFMGRTPNPSQQTAAKKRKHDPACTCVPCGDKRSRAMGCGGW